MRTPLLIAAFAAILIGPAAAQAATRCPAAVGRAAAVTAVPQDYLAHYKRYGARFGTPWQVLAAVGMTESHHGADRAAYRPHDRGVLGPMQFQAGSNAKALRQDINGNQGFGGTWGEWRTSSGKAPYRMDDPEDQIAAAAAKLRNDAGTGRDWNRALFRYNGLRSYVNLVLARARGYGMSGCGPTVAPVTPAATPPAATTPPTPGAGDAAEPPEADLGDDGWEWGDGAVTPPPPVSDADTLIAHPAVTLSAGARADLEAGAVDKRLVTLLLWIADRETIGITTIKTGHDKHVDNSTKVSNHWEGRAADIFVIGGSSVHSGSARAKALWKRIVALPGGQRPAEVGAPWLLSGWPRSFYHSDHLHVGFEN